METIDLKKPCPACGSHDIARNYREKGERLDQGIGSKYIPADENCIRNHCRMCGFNWTCKPLNDV